MIETSQFKRGVCIVFKGAPMMIVNVNVTTPTARGSNTISKTKLRNLLNGRILDRSYRSGDSIESADIEERTVQYLYQFNFTLIIDKSPRLSTLTCTMYQYSRIRAVSATTIDWNNSLNSTTLMIYINTKYSSNVDS